MLKAAAHLQKEVVATLFYRAVLLLTSQVKEGAGNHCDVVAVLGSKNNGITFGEEGLS